MADGAYADRDPRRSRRESPAFGRQAKRRDGAAGDGPIYGGVSPRGYEGPRRGDGEGEGRGGPEETRGFGDGPGMDPARPASSSSPDGLGEGRARKAFDARRAGAEPSRFGSSVDGAPSARSGSLRVSWGDASGTGLLSPRDSGDDVARGCGASATPRAPPQPAPRLGRRPRGHSHGLRNGGAGLEREPSPPGDDPRGRTPIPERAGSSSPSGGHRSAAGGRLGGGSVRGLGPGFQEGVDYAGGGEAGLWAPAGGQAALSRARSGSVYGGGASEVEVETLSSASWADKLVSKREEQVRMRWILL